MTTTEQPIEAAASTRDTMAQLENLERDREISYHVRKIIIYLIFN